MNEILKIGGLMAFSGIKFFFAAPAVIFSGYSFLETVLITTGGGVAGTLIFFYFGEWIRHLIKRLPNRNNRPVKRLFTKKNRRLVYIKAHYGLIGLAALTPCLLSIPIGSMLAARYFDHNKKTLPVMLASVFLWSLILTSFYTLFD
jgi:membrane protein YqaA with SNARE-associated domain